MTVIWVIQAVVAVALIIFIMLQSPKGEGLGAIGGSATLFKVQKKREKFLRNVSLVLAIVFAISSVILLVLNR